MRQNLKLGSILAATVVLMASASPAGGQESAPYRLTLREAIQKGLRANLSVQVAGTRIQEVEGTRERRLAGLLPHAHIETPATLQSRNLRTQGISFPGIPLPTVVGPFSTYEFRFYADQALLDLQSYHSWKASDKQQRAARNDYQDARDLVIRQIAGLYLNAQSAAALVEAAESRVTTSKTLHQLAYDQHQAGKATGVDVLRAQVQLANDQQSLLETRNLAKEALLVLARNIGMSLGTPIELAESLQFELVEAPEIPAAVSSALQGRADYASLLTQREGLVEQQKASQARWLPRISFNGNYGGIGRTLSQVEATSLVQATVTLTVFDRDREGERQELASRLQRLDHQIADLRLGIEQELRDALLNLESAAQEVGVAKQGLDLAQRELELARDRFQEGVTNNIEVVTAQDSLARAQQNYIVALTRHVDAKIAMARALGATEKNYGRYLGIR